VAKNLITIDAALCKGCLLCADACPKKILAQDKSRVNAKGYNPIHCADMGACTACAFCARICPDSVIKVERDAA
jgi:2-oxoglutarate ferredoxin oxidoreductase subunit delta